MPDFTPLAAVLGPVGIFGLVGWFVYLKYGDQTWRSRLGTIESAVGTILERGPVLTRIEQGVGQVDEQLRRINGRLGRIEEWRIAHDKQDDERHHQLERAVAEMRRHGND